MSLRQLGRYEIVSELGKGAMGIVYKARDPLLNRTVAIKTIDISFEQEERAEYEARFYQEAKAAGGLNHPSIVTIYDIGRSDNVAFMAMEFLDGRELRQLLAGGTRLAVPTAVDIAAQVAEGLAYAHAHHVVHRDIKPSNIMIVRDGTAKIMDFGIARMRSSEVRTQTGIVLGSPRYMSPEQVLGQRADHRSDIFSLGVVLWEMLTGQQAFAGENINAMMFQIVNLVPPAPGAVSPGVPPELDAIVARAIAKAPDHRYQDAAEFARGLRACADSVAGKSGEPASPAAAPAGYTVVDLEDKTPLLDAPAPGDRREDASAVALAAASGYTVSPVFDSGEATRKLAARAGMGDAFDDYVKTVKVAALRSPTQSMPAVAPIQRRDLWVTVLAIVLALAVAAAIVAW